MARHRVPRGSRSRNHPGGRREWIGGRLSPPFFIEDREEPYRAELIVWMEEPSGLVVGNQMIGPKDAEGALARALLAALERPLAGPPRRPDAIRVAEESLAAEVRAALGHSIPVTVAPTPELDALLEAMLESMPHQDEDESYLEGGRIPPSLVADLFTSAELLYQIAPWKVATDDQVVRMDIPALGVEGACVSIIGNLGQSLGLLVFPSFAGYEAFGRFAEAPRPKRGRLDLGTDWLALDFERGADLPAEMRREVAVHGWPVADANAYPRVRRLDRDGASRPLVERDLKVASACASALSAFFAKHRELFEAEEIEPVSESYFDERDLEVRFTAPYEAFALFDVEPAPDRAGRQVGRNDPCPCGSGRKYKKCHLPMDQAKRAPTIESARDHDLDGWLVRELSEFATARFGLEWGRFTRDFVDASETLQLAVPWSVYQHRVQGRTVAEWYLEEHGRKLSRVERGWLAAQQAAWLSVWEVVGVEPGETVTLRDLLSHQERCVREVSGSRTLVVRDALLARVVDHEGVSFLCGAHPRPLPPVETAEVVSRARGRLRRKGAVPVERLREQAFGRYLIKRWEDAVLELDLRTAIPPELHNTDGDPLLLTTDHFEFAAGARSEVEKRLAAMEGAEAEDPEGDEAAYSFLVPGNRMHASWENTVIGRARLSERALQLETNSRERADALRSRVEAACGGLLRHRAREHADPTSPAVAAAAKRSAPEPPPPEAEQIVLEFKQRHYADWVDQPLPALGGKTPREAAGTAQGRAAVDVLLKDMENHEQRSAGGSAFDFSGIRRELRLE